jgi:hypothetical protein
MKIDQIYSHLNGLEFLEARAPSLWREIESVPKGINVSDVPITPLPWGSTGVVL